MFSPVLSLPDGRFCGLPLALSTSSSEPDMSMSEPELLVCFEPDLRLLRAPDPRLDTDLFSLCSERDR